MPAIRASRHGLSIRNKLLVGSAVLVVLTALVFGLIAYRNARDALERSIGVAVAGAAYSTALDIQQELAEEMANVATWANLALMREILVEDVDKNISRFLAGLKRDYSVHLDLAVTSAGGRVVAASNPALLEENLASHSWFFVPQRGAQLAGGPLPLERYGKIGLVVTAPIDDPEQARTRIGVLAAIYDWERVHARLDWVRQPAQLHGSELLVFLLDETGTVIAEGGDFGVPSARIGTNLVEEEWEAARVARSGKSGFLVQREPAAVLTGFSPLTVERRGSQVQWTVLVAVEMARAFAPVARMQRNMILVGLLSVALAMSLALVMAGRISLPVRRLTEATRLVARGGDAEVVPVIAANDEIGMLSSAFRAMVTDLRKAEKELVRSARLALLGELSAGIAHEVRTPIGVVKGAAQMLGRSLGDNPEAKELAQVIASEMDRLNRMTGALLSYARPAVPDMTPRNLHLILDKAVTFLEQEAQAKGISLTLRLAENLPLVSCDDDQIREVILNIVMNAIQVTPAPGRVQVETSVDRINREVSIQVSDTGPGIPPELREKIFQPFFSQRAGGTGLGLAIASRIVEAHGGRITVEGAPGGGSRFTVVLPAAQEE